MKKALAMGKFAIIPYHCSNTFFGQFPNCLMYKKKEEFLSHFQYAMNNEPEPLSPEHSHMLTWEAATARCIEASKITKRDFRRRIRLRQPEMDESALDTLRGPIIPPLQTYVLDSMGVNNSSSNKRSTKSNIKDDGGKDIDSDPISITMTVERD